MSDKAFIDSCIFLYAFSEMEPVKQTIAKMIEDSLKIVNPFIS